MTSSDAALERLLMGFRSFRLMHYERRPERYAELVRGQSPQVMLIACCDARVDPAIVFDTAPGELFVVRNVANLVPPREEAGAYHGTSAALEFGVCALGVGHVVVLGHAQCGGIRSLVRGAAEAGDYIRPWMAIAAEAGREVLARLPGASEEERAAACERAAIGVSLRNLRTFPWVAERVSDGRLQLHGWYFDLAAGALLALEEETGQFRPLA